MKIEKMTAAQRRAIESDAKEILCVAGPGSGKTTVLTARLRRIIDMPAHHASGIAAITYTNAAARNLEERLSTWSDIGSGDILECHTTLGFAGTLHGFCLRMLKRYGGGDGYGERTAIIDEDASRELIEAQAKALGCKTPTDKLLAHKGLGRPAGPNPTVQDLVVLGYIEEMAENGLLDFDLILTEFYRLLVMSPMMKQEIAREFEYLFVDEVQDCSLIDWKIFLGLPIENKFLVGDPDQAIFGFRGGDPSLMVRSSFMSDATVIWLEENFRCKQEICDAANLLIAHNTVRTEKKTISAVGAGGCVRAFGQTMNEGDEIAQVLGYMAYLRIHPEQLAIIARTNAIAAGFRDALKAAGIEVEEPPKATLPPDWPLARAIVEMMAQPANDTLAYFYCIAKAKNRGASDKEARDAANLIRNNARAKGQRINHGWAGAPPTIMDVPAAMDRDKISLESRMIVGAMIIDLPKTQAANAILELALEVSHLTRTPEIEEPAKGVAVTTIHAAKGREWDYVFIVGFEDEVIPGTAKSADIEEERRLAFVALTRARTGVYISHAQTRKVTWGRQHPEQHNPSRFLKEIRQ